MNKRIFLYTFLVFISANSLFAVTNEWVAGGTAGDWEDLLIGMRAECLRQEMTFLLMGHIQ